MNTVAVVLCQYLPLAAEKIFTAHAQRTYYSSMSIIGSLSTRRAAVVAVGNAVAILTSAAAVCTLTNIILIPGFFFIVRAVLLADPYRSLPRLTSPNSLDLIVHLGKSPAFDADRRLI